MKRVRRIVIPLVILAALLFIADRGAVAVAQRTASSKLGDYGQFQKPPTVRIHGFPFLTQAIGGKFDDIEVRSDSVSFGNVNGAKLDVHLHGASVSLSDLIGGKVSVLPVGKVQGNVEIPYGEIARLSKVAGLAFVRNGDFVSLTGRPTIAGLGAVGLVNATASISVVSGGLRVTVKALQINGAAVTGPTLTLMSGVLNAAVVLPPLPYGLVIDSVQVVDDGLLVLGSGTDVKLTAS